MHYNLAAFNTLLLIYNRVNVKIEYYFAYSNWMLRKYGPAPNDNLVLVRKYVEDAEKITTNFRHAEAIYKNPFQISNHYFS